MFLLQVQLLETDTCCSCTYLVQLLAAGALVSGNGLAILPRPTIEQSSQGCP